MSPVVVVGPVSWNQIVQVPHLPDARPQTVFADDSWVTLGGTSAGKALHLADLGVPVTLCTVVGADPEGELIVGALDRPLISLVAERVETRSERHLNLMAGDERVSIYLSPVSPPSGAFPAAAVAAIERAEHVVLDLSPRARAAIPLITEATVWTDLHDYDGRSSFHEPFLDAADLVFLSNDAVGDPRPLMTRILALGKRLVVCTLGPDGALALDHDGWHETAAAPVPVIDTNGAGDAFLSGFLGASLHEATVDEALRAGTAQATRALGSRHLA